ncbi:MAG: VOC family protein [Deltaproteobacteria bacterium]|nr:VOC family protein [Deltaproteobacteria bacterium]
MNSPTTRYAFTKLIVNDLEKMSSFYTEVYDLEEVERIQSAIGSDPIHEIMLGIDGEFDNGLVLLKFVDKPAPENGELILGFTTDDVAAVYERVRAAGGGIHASIKHDAGSPYKVGFVRDPEGHLAEVVETVDQDL